MTNKLYKLSEIAEIKGVSRQSVARKVNQLIALGLINPKKVGCNFRLELSEINKLNFSIIWINKNKLNEKTK